MIRIDCPHCGTRDHSEFLYLGDATAQRPGDNSVNEIGPGSPWSDYVFQRDNPRGVHREFWQHAHGCRAWLLVTRDTLTHDVSDVRLATEDRS